MVSYIFHGACLLWMVSSYCSTRAWSSISMIRGMRRCRTTKIYMNPRSHEELYGIPRSGWQSPVWNWGSAVGTGHDCAKICRQQYSSRTAREALVHHLLSSQGTADDIPENFAEVKLILALSWQRGRWDGSDGGKGGYSEVLNFLVAAERYEALNETSDLDCSLRWIDDIQKRFHLLKPSPEQIKSMQNIAESVKLFNSSDERSQWDTSLVYQARRQCSGLVLQAMGFIENGC